MLVKDSLQNKLIAVLVTKNSTKDQIIGTYENDKILYQELEKTLQEKISLNEEQKHNLKREIRKWKWRTIGLVVLDVVVIILIIAI